ncbi:MAG: type II toxin-antitoxin system prevent-host-death family antitoxin [Solirubrobacteraceae bacterium MAG38_C4-C5]|nr:type II toxin-antitoxin system prevent-host-death family antitoxin [Candidatus Siliceabacter maunaloa]
MSSYSIGEAKTQLSRLIREAESGEEVVVRRDNQPVARIVAVKPEAPTVKREPGSMRGHIWMADDWDEWPDDIAEALGMRG